MSSRYAIVHDGGHVAGWPGLEAESAARALPRRFNVSPGEEVPVIRSGSDGRPELIMARWGLIPAWVDDPEIGSRMINEPVERLSGPATERGRFRRQRCILPASGYYEWWRGLGRPQAFYVSSAVGDPLGFAGLWEIWTDPAGGERVTSCAMITCPAAPPLAQIHPRMPVVLAPAEQSDWLQFGDLALLWHGREDRLRFWPVSAQINSTRNRGPELIVRTDPQPS